MKLHELLDKEIDAIGDDHIGSNSEETPIKRELLIYPIMKKLVSYKKRFMRS